MEWASFLCENGPFHSSLERLLTDVEVRVRLAAGDVLGVLCAKIGTQVYLQCKDHILHLVQSNLERQATENSGAKQEQIETEKLMEKLATSSQKRYSADVAQLFHDTAGWKNLETSMKCLQAMIEGCGTNFQPFVEEDLLSLIFQTLTHTNRFVRETGYYVCSALVSCGNTSHGKYLFLKNINDEGRDSVGAVNPIFAYGHEFSRHLATGLADNWSQVRLAASVAARKFLMSLPDDKAREVFFPELLPQMCLNRYYVAEGVRIYSQETWRQVTGTYGKDLVQKYISQTVDYYILATESDNHAVREAACACIAELASKIQAHSVRPYVGKLLHTLLVCFRDESWPVRDAACVACGHFILCFPDESHESMTFLYPLFFGNLEDPIPTVRQGAAVALANVVRAYGQESLAVLMERVTQGLKNVRNQPQDSEKYRDLDKGQANFGIVKKIRDNDPELHSDNVMYSCGSLAPKMGRGGSDHKFRRPSQFWEMADGCVYLLSELSQIPEMSRTVFNTLPLVAEACHHRHYTHHLVFIETVCKQLPVIAKGIGKKTFKSVECENSLTSSAASQCLNQLGTLLGPNILRAKLINQAVTMTYAVNVVCSIITHVLVDPITLGDESSFKYHPPFFVSLVLLRCKLVDPTEFGVTVFTGDVTDHMSSEVSTSLFSSDQILDGDNSQYTAKIHSERLRSQNTRQLISGSCDMSRQWSQDIGMVLRGLQSVVSASTRLQEARCKQAWENSSVKTLAEETRNKVSQVVQKGLTEDMQTVLSKTVSETFQRTWVVVEGVRQYAMYATGSTAATSDSRGPTESSLSKFIDLSDIKLDNSENNYLKTEIEHETTPDELKSGGEASKTTNPSSEKLNVENLSSVKLSTPVMTPPFSIESPAGDLAVAKKPINTSGKSASQSLLSSSNNKEDEKEPKVTAKPKRKQMLSESAKQRKVPASRLERIISFGGLAAGLGVGTVAELARRSIGVKKEEMTVGRTLDSAFLSEANAERIVNTLCKVRGAALKLGQILSIQDNNIISPGLQKAFERVRQSADFMPTWQVEKVLTSELGDDWRSKVAHFEIKPFAAASIGQVHLVTLHNGTEAAMKIQYPGVAKGIESDIDNLVGIMKVWNVFPDALFVDNIVTVAKRELSWEVDYKREAECTKKFKTLVQPYPDYFVPRVIDELCTAQIFTTELIDGLPIDKCTDLDEETRHHIARLIMQLCLRELFEFLYMQTDPNWANFFYNPESRQLALLDFGASREYSRSFMDQYIEIIRGAADGDRDKVLRLSRDIGFLTGYESKVMDDAHVDTVMILGEVFRKPEAFDFGSQSTTQQVTQLVPTMLKHRLCPPPEEIYSLHRKLSGVFLLCSKLRVKMECRSMFDEAYLAYKQHN
uniref:ABC1 atypical kinase-like domain-containing protein n=1 Tax=Timema poppense TaxID=170557 RepID=A0A7R9CI94_TIMPO|nr:unnamed protein product [Timema poppensis]